MATNSGFCNGTSWMLFSSLTILDFGIIALAMANISSRVVGETFLPLLFANAGIMRVGTVIELNKAVGLWLQNAEMTLR